MTEHKEVLDMEFLSSKEVATALKCSLPTARNIMRRVDFPLVRVGKNMRVLKSAFLDWSNNRRV